MSMSRRTIFDSDSFDILVDGSASACISNKLADFVKPPTTSSIRVKGFNGTTSSTKVGTVRWSILADSGQQRTLEVHNTYYVPACPIHLLLPQHYSQQLQDHRGTYSVNFGDQVVLLWNHGRFKATMPLTVTNVGIMGSAPGHNVFYSFVAMGNQSYPTHFASTVVTNDEADKFEVDADDEATLSSAASLEGDDEDTGINSDSTSSAPHATTADEQSETKRPSVIPFDLDHDDPSMNVPSQDNDATSTLDSQAKLLRLHYHLGHLPFANICLMAAKGETKATRYLLSPRMPIVPLWPSNQEAVANQGTAQQDQNGYQTWQM
jgi:hypothetical protein